MELVRVEILLPTDWRKRAQTLAKRSGQTLSEWIRAQIQPALGENIGNPPRKPGGDKRSAAYLENK